MPDLSQAAASPELVAWVAEEREIDETNARQQIEEEIGAARHWARDHATVENLGLSQSRVGLLRQGALTRLYLRKKWEPTKGPELVAKAEVEKALKGGGRLQLQHGELRVICQWVVIPTAQAYGLERGDPKAKKLTKQAPESEDWWAAAAQLAQPIHQFIGQYADALRGAESCEDLLALRPAFKKGEGFDAHRIRYERFVTTARASGLDEEFVAQVSALEKPGLIPPFRTQFGLHVVFVASVEAPENEKLGEAALREIVRDRMLPATRFKLLRQELALRRQNQAVKILESVDGRRGGKP